MSRKSNLAGELILELLDDRIQYLVGVFPVRDHRQLGVVLRKDELNTGSPEGAAVLAFCTLMSRSRQRSGSTEVSRSTPSMLKPWSASNGENSPATPSIRSARRAVSALSSAIGRMSTSTDIVASAGRSSSR